MPREPEMVPGHNYDKGQEHKIDCYANDCWCDRPVVKEVSETNIIM